MSEVVKIHQSKQGRRPHFIPQWAEKFNMTQADLVRATGIDKGTVSRWFNEDNQSSPQFATQQILAELFHTEPDALFRHPDDDWLAQFFIGRKREEIERIKATLETAFPKTGTK